MLPRFNPFSPQFLSALINHHIALFDGGLVDGWDAMRVGQSWIGWQDDLNDTYTAGYEL